MQAYLKHKYGGPEVLKLENVEMPVPKKNEVLVKVKANSANPADWHIMRGSPFFARLAFGLFKPKTAAFGADFAGIIEKIGEDVTQFKVGDRVFGELLNGGAFAEYTSAPEACCAMMPQTANYTEMASIPIAGLTALQALTTHGKVKAGESVLINGSSGGVGHFAVQIAKAYQANVTAICSARNKTFVKSIGADQVIAYDKIDIHHFQQKFDLVVDIHGNLTFKDFKRMGHRGVLVGFTTLKNLMSVLLKSGFSSFSIKQFTAHANHEDLTKLAHLIASNKLQPHVEKVYPHTEIPKAIEYIEAMRTRGKVAMVWQSN